MALFEALYSAVREVQRDFFILCQILDSLFKHLLSLEDNYLAAQSYASVVLVRHSHLTSAVSRRSAAAPRFFSKPLLILL